MAIIARVRVCVLGVLLFSTCASMTLAAVTVGYVEDFSDGLADWRKGMTNPNYLSIVLNGGPGGPGDAYMQSVADGSSDFGRLTVFNEMEWSTDFIAAGISAISMDLLNPGAGTLSIRIGIRSSSGPGYISTAAYSLTGSSGWQNAIFAIDESSMTPVGNPGSFSSFIATGSFQVRILHATGTSNLVGNPISATLGIDNITAVPEPASAAFMFVGMCTLAACRRRFN